MLLCQSLCTSIKKAVKSNRFGKALKFFYEKPLCIYLFHICRINLKILFLGTARKTKREIRMAYLTFAIVDIFLSTMANVS